MPQTFLALAAVFCFGYLALSHQRSGHSADMRAVGAEVDLAATDVARALMTRVERNAFDEDDTGRTGVRTRPSALPLGPDDGEDATTDYDDVDDWSGYVASRVVPVGLDSLRFQEAVSVRYVDDRELTATATRPTLTKEITVVVVETLPEGSPRPPATATLRRVVTPAGIASATPILE